MNFVWMILAFFLMLGIALVFYNTIKVNIGEGMLLAVCVIVLGLFLGGLAGSFAYGMYGLCAVSVIGCLLTICGAVKEGTKRLAFLRSPCFLAIFLFFIYCLIVYYHDFIQHIDEFHQWAYAVKYMLESGLLPDHSALVGNQNPYTTGLFCLFFQRLTGYSEQNMYVASALLAWIGILLPFSGCGREDRGRTVLYCLLAYFGMYSLYAYGMKNLYVDMPVIAWCGGLAGWWINRTKKKTDFLVAAAGLVMVWFFKWKAGPLMAVLTLLFFAVHTVFVERRGSQSEAADRQRNITEKRRAASGQRGEAADRQHEVADRQGRNETWQGESPARQREAAEWRDRNDAWQDESPARQREAADRQGRNETWQGESPARQREAAEWQDRNEVWQSKAAARQRARRRQLFGVAAVLAVIAVLAVAAAVVLLRPDAVRAVLDMLGLSLTQDRASRTIGAFASAVVGRPLASGSNLKLAFLPFLVLVALLLRGTAELFQKKREFAVYLGYLLSAAAVFLAVLLYAYLFIFSYDESVRMASGSRYLSLYAGYIFILALTWLLRRPARGRERAQSWIAAGLLVFFLLGVNENFVPSMTGLDPYGVKGYDQISGTREQIEEIQRILTDQDRVYMLDQKGGKEYARATAFYYLGEQVNNYIAEAWKFTEDGSFTRLTEQSEPVIGDLPELLAEGGYTYLWVYRADDYLKTELPGTLPCPNKIKNGRLYRIVYENGEAVGLELEHKL